MTMVIVFSAFILISMLTDLALLYYVTKTLEKGEIPAFFIIEKMNGCIVAHVDNFPTLGLSLAITSFSGFIFDKKLDSSLAKKCGAIPAIVIISASAVIGAIVAAMAKSNTFCGYICPSLTCTNKGVSSCDGLLQIMYM
ncbi:MAG: hypothetical protein QW291_03680 [Thermofilaceae archaeon]